MPTLSKIHCSIQLSPTNTPLPEYKRSYLDSGVSVYIPVPNLGSAPSFNIHLKTDVYIAPGLAMFVFIDGQYQCNRSKMMPPLGTKGGLEMRVRQKEEKVAGAEGWVGCWYVIFCGVRSCG
jgi:hypothetical protein